MDEYIERGAALTAVDETYLDYLAVVKAAVLKIPAADVAPVVHGRWIPKNDGEWAECSECGEGYYVSTDGGMVVFRLFQKAYGYCPNCGARMDGGVNE